MLSRPELTRQFDLISNEALQAPITIIGAGAIGSSVALWLAKLGCMDITVHDPGFVDIENVSCQLYGPHALGKPKVEALSEIVGMLSVTKLKAVHSVWKPDPLKTSGIVIMAADCMEVRRQTFETITSNHFRVRWFIDARMGAESALMYCVNPFSIEDKATYHKTLYSNNDAVQVPCTAKSTGYTASMLSAWVVKCVKDLLTGNDYPRVSLWNIRESALTNFKKEVLK